jgi:tRNA threonylcarbamoyl adenosine modification protein YeaZ
VATGWEVAARRREADGRGQARVLLRLVEEMLGEVQGRPQDLSAVVAGTGPGTFTGIRVVVATARALGLALGVPVLGVSTLSALAASAAAATAGEPEPPVTLVPVVDARRGQLFYGVYLRGVAADGVEVWRRSGEYGVCDAGALGEVLFALDPSNALVVADDRDRVGALPAGCRFWRADAEAEWLVAGQGALDEPGDLPQGRRLLTWLAGSASSTPEGVGSPESVKPVYVRSPDADIHITKMKDPWGDGRRGR